MLFCWSKLKFANYKMASNMHPSRGLAASLDGEQEAENISLAIKFNTQKSYVVDVSAHDSVRDLKVVVAQTAGLSADNIRLVLAGQQLQDCDLLQSYGIGSHTTLHAFCRSGESAAKGDHANNKCDTEVRGVLPLADSAVHNGAEASAITNGYGTATLHSNLTQGLSSGATAGESSYAVNRSQGYNRFFVYCKLCDGIRPAKLRLVCRECGNGAFLVDRGPANWDDISSSTPITGKCTSDQCTCTTPRFYLRCCERHEGDVNGTAVVLKHVNTNRRRVECLACGDVASHVLIFPCVPGHVTCLACFRQYCSVCLSERRFTEHEQHGYTLPCPVGCPDSHIEETHHFMLMGKEKYERYKNFGAEEFVLQNGGILCPAPGCGMGLFPEDDVRKVTCGECQFESCKDCRREYHTGFCGDEMNSMVTHDPTDLGFSDEMAERACWERQSMSLIEETTKGCPTCHSKTERSGGCMHMVCSRCGCEWCWICVKPWSRDCMAEHWFG